MTSEEILSELQKKIASGEVTVSEIKQVLAASNNDEPSASFSGVRLDVTKILYGGGGRVVLVGLAFLIYQMWDSFGPWAQVVVSLGGSLALYVMAVLLQFDRQVTTLSAVLFVISALLMPFGIFITLHHFAPGDNLWLGQLLMSGLPAAVFFSTHRFFRHNAIYFVSLLLATWAFFSLIGLLLDATTVASAVLAEIWAYVTLFTGFSYVFISRSFRGSAQASLMGILYLLGGSTGLGAGIALTALQDVWLVLYFLLVLGSMYAGIFLPSRTLLLLGAVGLIVHLTRISLEYFADSLGWPFALIISGFIIIGVGYGTLVLNNRYIKTTNTV